MLLIGTYFFLHLLASQTRPVLAVYGYSSSEHSPFSFSTYLKASSISPPSHPLLPSRFEQSISSCSDRVGISSPVTSCLIAYRDSNEPVVENAQQEPQDPWFLTAVTYDFPSLSVQSISVGLAPALALDTILSIKPSHLNAGCGDFAVRQLSECPCTSYRNSSSDKSPNWFNPNDHE